jgi:predicted nucleotide-binding protein
MNKTVAKINELEELRHNILSYIYLVRRYLNKERLTNAQKDQMAELHAIIGRQVGHCGKLITELTGLETVDVHGKDYDMWVVALGMPINKLALSALSFCLQVMDRAIGQLEEDMKTGIRDAQTGKLLAPSGVAKLEPPKAFIAHGGKSEARDKLCQFLTALGVIPIIVEEQPSEGRSVGENVDWYARQSDCAIILATKGDIDSKTGKFIPRGNVLIEIGKSQELFKDRIIYLLQAGTKLPTNINEKVRARFTSQNMDNAFIKIATELRKFGILRAVKP